MHSKFERLKKYLSQNTCLAFSGGTDSTLLLYLCRDLNITAVTFRSVFQTKDEIDLTKKLCEKYNVRHKIIDFYPLEDEILKNNPKDRCYHCKKLMFTKLKEFSKEIIDGTNFDDINTNRPGLKALKELNILSPFAECKITKQEIRDYAKFLKIPVWNKPSSPCLATRFPYNTELNENDLKTVENGEKILKSNGFTDCRLRLHKKLARIEIPTEQFSAFLSSNITSELKKLNIEYVTLDTEGIRSIDKQNFTA